LFNLIHYNIAFLKLLIYLLKYITIQLLLLYVNRLMMTLWFLFQILLIFLFTVAIILNTFDLWKVIYLLNIFKFIQTALEWNHLQNTVLLWQNILNIILYKKLVKIIHILEIDFWLALVAAWYLSSVLFHYVVLRFPINVVLDRRLFLCAESIFSCRGLSEWTFWVLSLADWIAQFIFL
jgi:hypothetical protein